MDAPGEGRVDLVEGGGVTATKARDDRAIVEGLGRRRWTHSPWNAGRRGS